MVDKISTITQQQRSRPNRRERGSASSLAPTPAVSRMCHASPATLCASASRSGCVYRCQAQRTARSVCCMMPCGLYPRVLRLLSRCSWRATVFSSAFVGQSYGEVHSLSFTQIIIYMRFWGKFFLQSSLGGFFNENIG